MNNNSTFDNKDNFKKANQNLEQKYRLLFEKSPVGIFQFDNNAIIIDCNDRFIEILKSSREKVIGFDMQNLKDKSVLNVCLDAIKGVQGFYEGIYHVTTS
ncbi:MAG: PAS domain-containing protein, partial [Bacteroidales bacterium]